MSDFLSQFTKENYDRKKMKITSDPTPVKEDVEIETKQELDYLPKDNRIKESKNEVLKETLLNNEEDNSPMKLDLDDLGSENDDYYHEEETEIDPEYKKKKQKRIIMGSILGVALLIAGIFTYISISQTKMPDFAGVSKQEVLTWSKKNNIEIIWQDEFSLEYDEDTIISQSVEPDSKIKKGSDMTMVVSKGADPDEKVEIPDFSTMKASEIEEWVSSMKMRYIQVEYVYSVDVEKDVFISFDITDKGVTKESFLRKNKGQIKISKGKEVYEKNIVVPDFKGKTKAEIETWMKEKEFVSDFVFEEAYDNDKMEGEVLSQGTKVGEKVAKDDVLTFVISKGKAMLVPNYAGSELSTFDTIATNGVSVIQKEIYTMNYAYGAFVSQSVGAGAVLNDSPDTIVIVYYSIGRPYLKDLVGITEGDLPAYFYDFNGKGASITYSVVYVAGSEPKGQVTSRTRNNEYVSTSDHIVVYISRGNLPEDTGE